MKKTKQEDVQELETDQEEEKTTETGEAEETGQETQDQETETQQEDAEGDSKEASTGAQETDREEQSGEAETGEADASAENDRLRRELLEANGKLAAYAAGIAPGMVADAVTLAMAQAQEGGAVTEQSISDALKDVLKRHPEWKAENTSKKTGAFKLGADPDKAGKKSGAEASKNIKRWNRFK